MPHMEEASESQVVHVRLIPAQTAEERKRNIIANVVLEGRSAALPFIDDAIQATNVAPLQAAAAGRDEGRAPLRYYAAGPRTYRTKCPLCRQCGEAAVMLVAGLKEASCCLSVLSCFFPIFWLCCVCTWCGCNRQWTTKGLYCNKCGGKLGVQQKSK